MKVLSIIKIGILLGLLMALTMRSYSYIPPARPEILEIRMYILPSEQDIKKKNTPKKKQKMSEKRAPIADNKDTKKMLTKKSKTAATVPQKTVALPAETRKARKVATLAKKHLVPRKYVKCSWRDYQDFIKAKSEKKCNNGNAGNSLALVPRRTDLKMVLATDYPKSSKPNNL